MDQSTARRMARQMNAVDPAMTAVATTTDHLAGRWESSHDWVVRTLDGRVYRDASEWTPPVYENPRYVPEKIEGYWRVRDTHNRALMADAYYDVMAAEDDCLSLNRPQVPPTEPSDSQLRLLCDISAQREDDPELRMRASEVRWLAREARRAAQMDEEIAELRAALLRRGPSPFQLLKRVHQVLAELPKRTPGTKTPELTDSLT
jgi:hypothetical protein